MQIPIRMTLYEQSDLGLHHLIRPIYLSSNLDVLWYIRLYVLVKSSRRCTLFDIDSALIRRYEVESMLIQYWFSIVCPSMERKWILFNI